MPELPDLEAIRGFLNQRIVGKVVQRADVLIPVVIRVPRDDYIARITGVTLGEVTRFGKFLFFSLSSGEVMVINPMLTGRFAYVERKVRKPAKTCFVFALDDDHDLRYADARLMGRVYLVKPEDVASLPQLGDSGPDVLDPALTEAAFAERLRRHNGMIKSILTNHKFVAGIGNAYSDEILWEARIHPYRKRTAITDEEVAGLYRAVHAVLDWATPIVAEKLGESLDYTEWREHLRVHRRGGQPCPRCGATISEITAGQRVTSFCRHCQP
jgi:formamidopyrimidine-DNA glycosylase